MQYYRLLKPVNNLPVDFLISRYNRFMHKLAYKAAEGQVAATNKSYYGAEMFGSIVIFSSVEKDDINRKMPKGNKMNIAELLRHKVFLITPNDLRKKNM